MSVVFISHSSKDDSYADALEVWLKANGVTSVFIDHSCIAAGDKWRDALRAFAKTCRAVICLVTPNWLASDECFGEFTAALYMSKHIIPLILLPSSAALTV